MGDWRFYAQRAGSGLWLDTDAQLQDVEMDWILSGPSSGEAYVPSGLAPNPKADDGRLKWSKWDTILLAEEDGNLAWGGVCTAANPDERGFKLEFTGITGWLEGIPYNDALQVWRTNVFDVVRRLVNHSATYPRNLPITVSKNDSLFTVGDAQPPDKPKEPARRKGESKSDWKDSARYKKWEDRMKKWEKQWGDNERFEIVWWESPSIGEELATLAKEASFDYLERVRWTNKARLEYEWHLDLADDIRNRRDDLAFTDGLNLAEPFDTKDSDQDYGNQVIALGAGEGRDMRRATVSTNDGRLFQAVWVEYKSVRSKDRLRQLADADLKRFSSVDPEIDTVVVWDVPGYASLDTLRCGDEVRVVSDNTQPAIDTWKRVAEITRNPVDARVTVGLETA